MTRPPAVSLLLLAPLALAGCGGQPAPAPASVDICTIHDHLGQRVSTEAFLASAGDRTLLSGAGCRNLGLELKLTDAAFRAGQIDRLRAAVRAAPAGTDIAVQLTGVLVEEATGTVFSVESVGTARYPAVN